MLEVTQELMTPHEAARWFRRSASWLRQQPELLRVGAPGGQPLFHTQICRAFVLGRVCGLTGATLRRVQILALAAGCGLSPRDLPDEVEQRLSTMQLPVCDGHDAAGQIPEPGEVS